MRSLATTIALLFCALFLPRALGQTTAGDLSPLIEPIVKKYKLPGMAAVLVKESEIAASGVSGVRKLGDPMPIDINDRFHIGSCTKAMTATLAAILVEEDKLTWDTTISRVFPELSPHIDPANAKITLTQLLTHRSGLAESPGLMEVNSRFANFKGMPSEARLAIAREALANKPANPAGARFAYSSLGYLLAGAMCERVAHLSYEDLMRQRIFQPLGMTSAGFGPPGTPGKLDQPLGHSKTGIPVEPTPFADNHAVWAPAGTVHCSLPDWAKFTSAHLMQDKLLKPETYAVLHTAVRDPQSPYAMGWNVYNQPWAHGQVLNHMGTNTMWVAVVWMAPQRKAAILIATNQAGLFGGKACDELCLAIVREYLEKTGEAVNENGLPPASPRE